MHTDRPLEPAERRLLVALAVLGVGVLNSAFLYGLFHLDTLTTALTNPISLAFIVEALLLVPLLAWLLRRASLTRLHWGWVVALSLLGGLAFAIPLALLCPPRRPAEQGPAESR